ncbi:cytochrome P450 [Ophiobolus disseminans]|uniref:Cytochrome P450 n=1 Tax=Ophiobolus disseminans TaxID=1469910 RepID=A0A6A6ZWN3_9PLEO|nr:cytochrome P450 [Ophiobolus disseminans]
MTCTSAAVVMLSSLAYFLYIGYCRRLMIHNLRNQGVPILVGWSWWMGHLLVLNRLLKRLPADANVLYAWQELFDQNPANGVFLLDLWPVYTPQLLMWDAEASNQVTTRLNLTKPASQHQDFRPVVGGVSMISMSNEDWKPLRAIFNPGFSGSHMLELVPAVVDSVELFCELLRNKAGTSYFPMDNYTTRLTMDVIIKVVLDTDLDNQRHEHHLSKALNTVLAWHSFWDPRILLNPLRPLVQWYFGRIMDRFLRNELQKRYSELKNGQIMLQPHRSNRGKSVITLALEDYIKQGGEEEGNNTAPDTLAESFMRMAATQIRLFIFAGNDSTSSSIVYALHLLHQHPMAMEKLRKEHDEIFGIEDAAAQLKDSPALLNRCVYTLAVIKETLRVFPPAGTVRDGRPGASVTDCNGNIYPVEHVGPLIAHRYVHRNPGTWVRPDDFLPERWLVEPGHELYPPQNAGAYRPFEQGPRNCIGQTLVLNEMRIVLIMVARTFEIKPAYDEWDAAQRAKAAWPTKLARKLGLQSDPIRTVMGERAYQTSRAGAHPADGYPCRVTFVDR